MNKKNLLAVLGFMCGINITAEAVRFFGKNRTNKNNYVMSQITKKQVTSNNKFEELEEVGCTGTVRILSDEEAAAIIIPNTNSQPPLISQTHKKICSAIEQLDNPPPKKRGPIPSVFYKKAPVNNKAVNKLNTNFTIPTDSKPLTNLKEECSYIPLYKHRRALHCLLAGGSIATIIGAIVYNIAYKKSQQTKK